MKIIWCWVIVKARTCDLKSFDVFVLMSVMTIYRKSFHSFAMMAICL